MFAIKGPKGGVIHLHSSRQRVWLHSEQESPTKIGVWGDCCRPNAHTLRRAQAPLRLEAAHYCCCCCSCCYPLPTTAKAPTPSVAHCLRACLHACKQACVAAARKEQEGGGREGRRDAGRCKTLCAFRWARLGGCLDSRPTKPTLKHASPSGYQSVNLQRGSRSGSPISPSEKGQV